MAVLESQTLAPSHLKASQKSLDVRDNSNLHVRNPQIREELLEKQYEAQPWQTRPKRRRRPLPSRHSTGKTCLAALLLATIPGAEAGQQLQAIPRVKPRNADLPLTVTNNCGETIYAAILTQGGTGPASSGFRMDPGDTNSQTVSFDWRGRVWGRTNCTFASNGNPASGQDGTACMTGDCGNFVECQGAGQPATLAEFTYSSNSSQAFYDISLVDGYNLPMGIISLLSQSTTSNNSDIPPNLTNPVCIGTAALLSATTSSTTGYSNSTGTNATYPLPLDQSVTSQFVSSWCPWPLQILPPTKPGDGVYPYPDDNIVRPVFDPCLSACSKWNKDQYCCTGSHDSPSSCSPSYYSTQAKAVCPDAYSYAYDDKTSTFGIPQGGGFEVVFCPVGRSTNILQTFGQQLQQIAQHGIVTRDILEIASNVTYIKEKNEADILKGLPIAFLVIILLSTWLTSNGVWSG